MALKATLAQQKVRYCKMATSLEHFTKEDVETLQEWFDQRMPVNRIVQALRAEYPEHCVVEATVFKHLRGTCCCASDAMFYGIWNQ